MRLSEDGEDQPESLVRITSLCPRPHSAKSGVSNEASAPTPPPPCPVSRAGRPPDRWSELGTVGRARHQRDDRSG